VPVEPGDVVDVGQGLVVVEAMKMENEIVSPVAGVVQEVSAATGDSVETGAVLVVVGAQEND
jgi:biotin carboxyl carrier protein